LEIIQLEEKEIEPYFSGVAFGNEEDKKMIEHREYKGLRISKNIYP